MREGVLHAKENEILSKYSRRGRSKRKTGFDVIFIDIDFLDRGSEVVGIAPMASFLSNYGDNVQMSFVDLNDEGMEQRVHLYLKQTKASDRPFRATTNETVASIFNKKMCVQQCHLQSFS